MIQAFILSDPIQGELILILKGILKVFEKARARIEL
jgi:hypothetical protein